MNEKPNVNVKKHIPKAKEHRNQRGELTNSGQTANTDMKVALLFLGITVAFILTLMLTIFVILPEGSNLWDMLIFFEHHAADTFFYVMMVGIVVGIAFVILAFLTDGAIIEAFFSGFQRGIEYAISNLSKTIGSLFPKSEHSGEIVATFSLLIALVWLALGYRGYMELDWPKGAAYAQQLREDKALRLEALRIEDKNRSLPEASASQSNDQKSTDPTEKKPVFRSAPMEPIDPRLVPVPFPEEGEPVHSTAPTHVKPSVSEQLYGVPPIKSQPVMPPQPATKSVYPPVVQSPGQDGTPRRSAPPPESKPSVSQQLYGPQR